MKGPSSHQNHYHAPKKNERKALFLWIGALSLVTLICTVYWSEMFFSYSYAQGTSKLNDKPQPNASGIEEKTQAEEPLSNKTLSSTEPTAEEDPGEVLPITAPSPSNSPAIKIPEKEKEKKEEEKNKEVHVQTSSEEPQAESEFDDDDFMSPSYPIVESKEPTNVIPSDAQLKPNGEALYYKQIPQEKLDWDNAKRYFMLRLGKHFDPRVHKLIGDYVKRSQNIVEGKEPYKFIVFHCNKEFGYGNK